MKKNIGKTGVNKKATMIIIDSGSIQNTDTAEIKGYDADNIGVDVFSDCRIQLCLLLQMRTTEMVQLAFEFTQFLVYWLNMIKPIISDST